MTRAWGIVACTALLASVAFAQGEKKEAAPAKAPAAGAPAAAAPAKAPAAGAPAAGAPAKAPAAGAPAAAAPAGPPKPAPEFITQTKYFLGKWKCEGMMPAGPMGPEAKQATNLNFKMDLGDFYLIVDGDMKVESKPPMKMTFKGINGYDAMAKKFTRADFDSMGNMMHMTSAGWEGDKMVFTGEGMMMGQKVKMKHTMTKKSDTEMTSAFEQAGADGKWMPAGEDTCKKAGGKK
jgi:hypothetical protein